MLPLLLGSREMAFPRLSSFTYWTYLFGGLLFYSSTLPDILNFVLPGSPLPEVVPAVGWFAYPPLSGPVYSPGLGVDFYLLGLGFAEISGIAAAAEIVGTIFKLRAPGMSLERMPLFAWAILIQAFAILLAFPAVLVASTFLELERKFNMPFFDPTRGGDPLLWQHLFWFFGHPEVYIMLIPGTGILSMIVPTVARRPIAGYAFIVTAIAATGFLSFGLWLHHMFAVGLPFLTLAFFGAASMTITIPSGVQVFAWIATLLNAPRPKLTTPLLYVIGATITFVAGGVTGVMTASVPYDWQVHDTYFVVAHFHYVLIGGVVFPILGGLIYWWPKLVGRQMDERLGVIAFWLLFLGFNVAFLPQHSAGLLGMPRRVSTYESDLGIWVYNLASTIGAFLMAAGVFTFLANAARSIWQRDAVPADPWGGSTLEWSVGSPPPSYSFANVPAVGSREPLWRDGLSEWRPERTAPQEEAPTSHPGGTLWREVLVTSSLEARPQAICVVAGPSYAPFLLAAAVTAVSVALIFDLYVAGAVALVLCVPLAAWWMWPCRAERALRGAGRTLGSPDLPAHARGTPSIGWWGMVISLGALAITLGLFVFSYFYLMYGGPEPVTVPLRPLGLPVLAGATLVASAISVQRADRAILRERRSSTTAFLAAGIAATVAYLILQTADLLGAPMGPQSTAYGAILWCFWGFQLVLAGAAVLTGAYVLLQHLLGYFDARRNQALQNTALLWWSVAASGVVTMLTLSMSPYLLTT
jgi:cytochrome c oxidase subunit I+III